MTGLRSRVAVLVLLLAGLAVPVSAAGPPAQLATALVERSKAMNRLVRERPELFEAIGAALAEAEARQDTIAAYGRRWEALERYCSAACGPR